MPWLTPDDIPEDDDCRPLSIPASTDWLALVSGALTELTKPYNWQRSGALTVGETVAKMQEIVDGYYSDPCEDCTLPEGGKIIRIGEGGHLQELGGDGSWQDASGDYAIPPPASREGGEPADQNCLAAKNATNVLEQLYENLTDSWNSELSEAEAMTAFTLGLIGLVGFEFAPITASIVAFFGVAFTALYEALAYIGADIWDDAVSKQIECFLLECASNDAGVVTFDWDCFVGKLNSLTNSFGLSELQVRLYLQITFMLYFIGGVAGLNLAGATTAITDDDCSDCGESCPDGLEWCKTLLDAAVDYDGGFETYGSEWDGFGEFAWSAPPGEGARWVTSQCADRGGVERATLLQIQITLPAAHYTYMRVDWAVVFGTFTTDIRQMQLLVDGTPVISSTSDEGTVTVHEATIDVTGTPLVQIVAVLDYINPCVGCTCAGFARVVTFEVGGLGTDPYA